MSTDPEALGLLLVGDASADLAPLAAVLAGLGLDIVRASSEEEALRAVEARDFVAVVLDGRMPAGLESARVIRERARPRHIPMLVLAGEDVDDAAIVRAYQLGAVDDLIKPVIPEVVRVKVEGLAALFRERERSRREAEELRERQAELTDFVENAPVGLHWVGPDGTILWTNKAELDLLGYAKEEYVGRNIAEFHADTTVVSDILCRLTNGEELHSYEARLRCRNGSIRHVLISSNVYREGGEFRHTRCFTRDITEKRRAEGRQRFLADQAAATQPLTDPDEITAATARVLGEHMGVDRCAYAELDVDEDHFNLTGNYCRDVPSIVGRYALSAFGAECLRLHLEGKPYVVDDAETDPRVSPADLSAYRQTQIRAVISVPLHKGRRFVAGMAVHQARPRRWTADDVELVQLAAARCWESIERARAIRTLRESEERFRTVADSAPVLIWMNNEAGAEFVNREYLAFLGRTWEEVQRMEWTSGLHPDDAEEYVEGYRMAFVRRERFEAQFRFHRHDGEYRWLHSVGVPRFGPDGGFLGYIGCSVDITDVKRAEEMLIEADRHKDEFIAMLAHELRNPLAPITNALHILQLRKDEQTVERVKQIIGRQVGQLSHLVNDLLEVARAKSGKIVLRRELLDLSQLARVATSDEKPAGDAAGLSLTSDTPETPVWVSGDWTRLAQIVGNLLQNAIKFTERGGHVTVLVRSDGPSAVLTVRDTGRGIAPELLPRLFTPFTQAEQGLARSQGGLGLGLTLVRRLTELHGGSVTAESDGPGRGSIFTIRLPRAEEPSAITGEQQPMHAARGRSLRVLVVEDNPDTAESLRMVLELGGCEVTVAGSGPEGVAAARRLRPHLVLCDIGLPGFSGYEVARRIRSEVDGRVMLIALTGYGRDEDRELARAAGFHRHFTKPIDFSELEAVINSVT